LARAQALADPPERIDLVGAVVAAQRRERSVASSEASDVRRGTGCAPGFVRGPAKVVRDPRSESVRSGEILVARHTDPGWIALFANTAGIVVERGSLLSHSAIVAREMGIPCVVGLKGAVAWIATGETIEIDGASGEVRKCR
jgi:pyruvate,water dikinase